MTHQADQMAARAAVCTTHHACDCFLHNRAVYEQQHITLVHALNEDIKAERAAREAAEAKLQTPIAMVLFCPNPACGAQHLDEGEWSTRPHRTHQCQSCGTEWRPANVATVGVLALAAKVTP